MTTLSGGPGSAPGPPTSAEARPPPTGSFAWWTRREAAELFDLHALGDLRTLRARYAGSQPRVFENILGHAYDLGGRSVVAEYRYVDADYRNEHARFYATTFRRYPSIAHRLHFFSKELSADALDARKRSAFPGDAYLGYAVIRPVSVGTVGRTMLCAADELAPHVSCKAKDEVNLFGSVLPVTAAPFMTQETQLGVCVHVTAWVCAYYHHLAYGAPRYLPGDIAAFAPSEVGRLVPAIPMTTQQLTTMLDQIDLPPVVYDLRDLSMLPDGESLYTIACRYLNSGLPVVVAGGGHAFVLVGYRRLPQTDSEHAKIEFIRQDDQLGTYQIVDTPDLDPWRPWQYLIIPLPRKVYVSGETAETVAKSRLEQALGGSKDPAAAELLARIRDKTVVFRSSVMPSNTFKEELGDRNATPDVIAAYQWAQMSRWVWIIEAVDHEAWNAGDACVEAEVVVDATDHAGAPGPIAWRLPDRIVVADPDWGSLSQREVQNVPRLKTVCRVDAALIGNAET